MLPEGWIETPLEGYIRIHSGVAPGGLSLANAGPIPYVKVEDLNNCAKYQVESREYLQSAPTAVPQNALIFPKRGAAIFANKIRIASRKMALDTNLMGVEAGRDLDEEFLFYAISFAGLHTLADTSTIPQLNNKHVYPYRLARPALKKEQCRIAKILATWDDAIIAKEKLVAESRKQLTGLAQTLLSGSRRLSGASAPWRTIAIAELLKAVKRPAIWDDDRQYPLISVRRRSGGAFHRETLYGREILTKKLNAVEVGDFLISKMQVVHGAMAIVPDALAHMFVSDSYIALQAIDRSSFDLEFFGWLSTTPEIRKVALRSSYGVHIEKMTFDLEMFLREKISVPSSLEEQQAISKVLDTGRQEIRALEQQLDALQEEKRALMADLLTGKRRVKLPSTDTVATPP